MTTFVAEAQAKRPPVSASTFFNRQPLYLRPDPSRVVVRPFRQDNAGSSESGNKGQSAQAMPLRKARRNIPPGVRHRRSPVVAFDLINNEVLH